MEIESYATLERQWTMLRLIPAAPQSISVAALVDGLRAEGQKPTRRTVARDLHAMSARFPLVVDDSGKTHRWSWEKQASVDFLPRLNASQCLALAVVRKHMATLLPKAVLDDLAPLFDAAERELASSGWKDWPARIAVAPPAFALLPPRIDAKVLADVQHAIARRVKLIAKYRSVGARTATRRSFDPLGLLLRGHLQYLIAQTAEHPEPRQYALQRLRETAPTNVRCHEPHGFSMRKYARDLAIAPRGWIRLRLHFHARTAEHVREMPMSKYQTWRPIEGTGKIEVCATVQDDVQLKRWLLSLGMEAEVREPVRLRREIAGEMREVLRAYDA